MATVVASAALSGNQVVIWGNCDALATKRQQAVAPRAPHTWAAPTLAVSVVELEGSGSDDQTQLATDGCQAKSQDFKCLDAQMFGHTREGQGGSTMRLDMPNRWHTTAPEEKIRKQKSVHSGAEQLDATTLDASRACANTCQPLWNTWWPFTHGREASEPKP